ncbi:Golgi transport complex subunit 5-domain-containing protein [Scheffersomyces coipomensis]|uniref:Golgi transport complex subunit 5-domain-containing protein n=1 Tax=Scheffersomyces coipomensis TaxID=1788519 RepID=UPI00315DFF5E
MTTSTTIQSELEDFEAFIDPDFHPTTFANDLIVATNGNESNDIDLSTPIKKLKFDIQECNSRMTKIAANNYELLVSNFSRIEDTKSVLNDKINPAISQVNQKFDRIKSEVIEPYEEALRLNNALKRIHTTLDLLRGASFFIFIIQQLEQLEKSISSDNIKELPRLARLHNQLSELYDKANKNNAKDGNILSIKLIRDYYPIHVSKKSGLIDQSIQVMSNEFLYPSTFNVKNSNLENHLITFYLLDTDTFLSTFDKVIINKQVQLALTQLSRALQTPRNFTSILSEIKESSEEFFNQLHIILGSWEVSKNQNSSATSLEDILKSYYQNQDLLFLFYERLTKKFSKNIQATIDRGGPTSKNLKVYKNGLVKTIEVTFKNKDHEQLFLESISIINQ